MNIININK